MEHAVSFCNTHGQSLVGVWHEAASHATRGDTTTIIMLHGWSGYRTGPHQMLTRAARALAAAGYGVLRFDFAGRGDSQGDAEAATLATMADDTRAALAWCRSDRKHSGNNGYRAGMNRSSRFILLGLCSGCEVALVTATEDGVCGLALWSAPVFAAAQSDERTARKRAHHLKQYARKLLRPATYVKLLTGQLDTASIGKAVAGGGGGESKNSEVQIESQHAEAQVEAQQVAGHLPSGWRAAALKGFENFRAPLLMVYGTADPTTEEASAWYRERVQIAPQTHLVTGANHSYYGLAWEQEVIEVTQQWLNRVTSVE